MLNASINFAINESMIKSPNVWENVCELNQIEMLGTLQRFPKVAFWITVLMFIFLAIQWLVIPYFKSNKYYELFSDSFLGFAFALSVFPPLILFGYVYNLTTELVNKIEMYMWIFVFCFAIYWIYRIIKNRRIDNNGDSKKD